VPARDGLVPELDSEAIDAEFPDAGALDQREGETARPPK